MRSGASSTHSSRSVQIEASGVQLDGDLSLPERAEGLVVFAHGSGSGRLSPRNRFVAQELQSVGMATLLLDLLTRQEEEIDNVSRHLRFDIDLLARRVMDAIAWAGDQSDLAGLRVGRFGASTGAAAALIAAAQRPERVDAVVSRGGRPDLAGEALQQVRAPTLLIVGGEDLDVLDLNERAFAQMTCE